MDPLSFTASILAVIKISSPLIKTIKKAKSLGHASTELSSLLKDLDGLRIVIGQVENVILTCKDEKDSGWQTTEAVLGLTRLLDNAKASVLELDCLVRYDLTKVSISGDLKVDYFGWIKDKSKLLPIQRDIRSARDNLGIAVTSLSSLSISRTGASLNTLIASTEALKINQQAQMYSTRRGFARTEECIELLYTRPEAQFKEIQARLMNMQSIQLQSQERLEAAFEIFSRAEEKESRIQQHSEVLRYSQTPLEKVNRSRVTVTTRRFSSCRTFCNCVCHKQSRFQTPQLLNQVLGSLCVNYRGSVTGIKCNETSCQRRSPFSARFTCHLPISFLKGWLLRAFVSLNQPGPLVSLSAVRYQSGHEIFRSVFYGEINMARQIFARGEATPSDIYGFRQDSLLLISFHRRKSEMTRFLIQQGADLWQKNIYNMSAIYRIWEDILIFKIMDTSFYEEFLDVKDSIDELNLSDLHKYICGIDNATDEAGLMPFKDDVNNRDAAGRTPLAWAVLRKDQKKVNYLLENGSDPRISENDGNTPLHHAVREGFFECVEALLQHGADASAINRYRKCVLSCLRVDNINICEMLVDAGTDPHQSDHFLRTLLSSFAWYDMTECAIAILKSETINFRATDRWCPLWIFLYGNKHKVIAFLLRNGAAVDSISESKQSILHLAAKCADITSMRLLTKAVRLWAKAGVAKIDPNAKDGELRTATDIFNSREKDLITNREYYMEARLSILNGSKDKRWSPWCYCTKRDIARLRKAFEDLLDAARPQPIGSSQSSLLENGEYSLEKERAEDLNWDDCWSSGDKYSSESEDEDDDDEGRFHEIYSDQEDDDGGDEERFYEISSDYEDDDDDDDDVDSNQSEEFHDAEELVHLPN